MDNKNYQVEKSSAEVYTIRFKNNRSWWLQATIIENRGYLGITSSHGDYQYTWNCPGMPFKEFLIDIDDGYLKSKFGRMTFFDYDKTNRRLLENIIESRRTKSISAEEAREFHDFVINQVEGDTTNAYQVSMLHCPELIEKVYDGDWTNVPCSMDYEPGLRSFTESLWPTFIEVLKEELK